MRRIGVDPELDAYMGGLVQIVRTYKQNVEGFYLDQEARLANFQASLDQLSAQVNKDVGEARALESDWNKLALQLPREKIPMAAVSYIQGHDRREGGVAQGGTRK